MTDKPEITPLWQLLPFTEEERKGMVLMMEEEIRDSVNEIALETLNEMGHEDHMELIAYGDDDPGTTAELLAAILDMNAGMDDYRSGDHEDHVKRAEYMTRMGLVDEEDRVTPMGRKYVEAYG